MHFDAFMKTGILFDLILIAVIVLDMAFGVRRGFIRTIYHTCKTVVSAAAAFFLSKPLAAFVRETAFYKSLLSRIEETVGDYLSAAFQTAADGADIAFSDGMNALISVLGHTPEEIREQYSRMAAEKGEHAAQALVEYIVTPAAESVLHVLCFLFLFVITALLLYVLMRLLNFVASAPILSGANKILGLVAGMILAFLHVVLLCMLLGAAAPYLEAMQIGFDAECIQNAYLYRLFETLNPFRLTAL